jgi:Tol biopolymer transport system component
MEYLEGETLEQRLKKGALPLDEALKIAIQIADALSAAHRRGIVHRDLKPGNVMLTKQGAKLLDFGLAKASTTTAVVGGLSMLPTTPPNLTAQGTILGTFQYMAPEQLEGQEADARTDIWAFGAVLYEAVTGRKAFESKSQANLIGAILKDDPPSMVSVRPTTPPFLDHIVFLCFAKDPESRWQDAADLTHELNWLRESITQSGSSAPKGQRRRWPLIVGLSVVTLVFLLSWLVVRGRETPAAAEAVRLSFGLPADLLPTPGIGPGVQLALSPDGRQLALVAVIGKGPPMIWVRRLDRATGDVLRGTEGAQLPFWRPDSGALAFFADGKLKTIDLIGNSPQTVCDCPVGRGGTWNADGVIVIGLGNQSRLFRVSAAGGVPTPVTTLDTGRQETLHRWPQFLPDGHHFLFFTGGSGQARGIAVGSLDSPAVTHITSADARAAYASGYLLYVAEGALVARPFDPNRLALTGGPTPVADGVAFSAGSGYAAFSVSERGSLSYSSREGEEVRLTWVTQTGAAVEGTHELQATTDSAQLSPDGSRVVATKRNQRTGLANVWMFDVMRAMMSSPLILDTGQSQSMNAVWSPEGTRVVFSSNQHGNYDLFEKVVDAAARERILLQNRFSKFASQWSTDGRLIVFHQNVDGHFDVWLLPADGSGKSVPYLETPAINEVQGQLSPDGRWMAYASDASGRLEVWVQTVPAGGRAFKVSAAGGSDPHWRLDGRELFYLAEDRRLMAVPFQGGPVQPGTPKVLFETSMTPNIVTFASQYDVSADGQKFLIKVPVVAGGSATPITVLLNWNATVRK